jgi:hypothetical protein
MFPILHNPSSTLAHGLASPANRNEYQEFFLVVKRSRAHNANNLTAICELVVEKMWEPSRLTNQ